MTILEQVSSAFNAGSPLVLTRDEVRKLLQESVEEEVNELWSRPESARVEVRDGGSYWRVDVWIIDATAPRSRIAFWLTDYRTQSRFDKAAWRLSGGAVELAHRSPGVSKQLVNLLVARFANFKYIDADQAFAGALAGGET